MSNLPTRFLTVINAVPGSKIFENNKARAVFTIYLANTQAECYLSDNSSDINCVHIQPGDFLTVSVTEGHDTTKAWYLRSSAAGGSTVLLYEEILPPVIMEKIKEKTGMDDARGLLLLAGLGVLSS